MPSFIFVCGLRLAYDVENEVSKCWFPPTPTNENEKEKNILSNIRI